MNRALRPLVLALLALLAGLLPALRFAPQPAPLAASALAALLLAGLLSSHALGPARAAGLALLASFALSGAALGAHAAREAAADCRAHLPDGTRLRASGTLASGVFPADFRSEQPPLLPLAHARVRQAGRQCAGDLRIRLPDRPVSAAAGRRVEVVGEWVRWSGPVSPGGWPRSPEFSGHLQVDSVTVLAPPSATRHPLLVLRGRLQLALADLFPRHFALAEALLLGRRERMDRGLQQDFARTGLVHLLAISGMHVALFAAILILVGGVLRLPRVRLAWLSMAVVAVYLAVIGAPSSAVRAGIMIALALLSTILQRPSAALPMVAAAAMVIVAADPLAALEPGTQLSFAGVLGILFAHQVFPRRVLARLPGGPLRSVADGLLVSVAAFVATAPITAFHFGALAPVSLLVNLPAVPLSSLGLVGVVAAVVVAPVAPPLARLIADGTGVAFDALQALARWAATLPLAQVGVARPESWLCLAAVLALLAGLSAARRLRPGVRWGVGVGATLAVLLAWPTVAGGRTRPLEIFFLDVGQGDAVALHTPGDRWVLIDAGPRGRAFDAGERRVIPFLRARGARRLEALILTHPDADHIGGAPAVLRGIPVGRVIEPGLPVGKAVYMELLSLVQEKEVAWSAARPGRVLRLDGVELEFLWPDGSALDASVEANQISAVVRLRYGAFGALLPGDVSTEVEDLLAAREGGAIRVNVLKAGHHGSRTSTGDRLLRSARPELVVISAGRRNRYGHPAPEVLRRLESHGIAVARTDREGTVMLRVDPGGAWRRVEP